MSTTTEQINAQFTQITVNQILSDYGKHRPTGDHFKIWLAVALGAKEVAEIRDVTGLSGRTMRKLANLVNHGQLRKEADGYHVNSEEQRKDRQEALKAQMAANKLAYATWKQSQKVSPERRTELQQAVDSFQSALSGFKVAVAGGSSD